MFFLAVAIWAFTGFRLMIAAGNLLMRQWLKAGHPDKHAKISVLVPARNEEQNIEALLESIIAQDYNQWEAIIYDDLSEDRTAEIVSNYVRKDPRIRLVHGKDLPEGWLGKNHACHQLAQHAKGDCLLFVDADVYMHKTLLNDSLAHLQKHRLALLSLFPQQIMQSIGEKLSVPLMNWILVSLLPLILTRTASNPAFAAANGQFMLFDAKTYKQNLFHQRFKDIAAEDIAIARYMKEKGLQIHTVLSKGQVQCRMYRSLNEAIQGFAKNVIAFFGSNAPVALVYSLITTFGVVPVWLAMGSGWAAMYLAATLVIRMLVAIASKQSIIHNTLTAPLQQFVFVMVMFRAIYNKNKKKNIWKGRFIDS